MDVFTLLRRDHESVSSLFAQIHQGFAEPDGPERHRLFRELRKELELHAAVEDLHVYRVFQQAAATRDEAHAALDAHAKIKTLLDELEAAPRYDHTWVPRVQELQRLVEQHVALEENEMFPKAKSTKLDMVALGAKIAERKAELVAESEART